MKTKWKYYTKNTHIHANLWQIKRNRWIIIKERDVLSLSADFHQNAHWVSLSYKVFVLTLTLTFLIVFCFNWIVFGFWRHLFCFSRMYNFCKAFKPNRFFPYKFEFLFSFFFLIFYSTMWNKIDKYRARFIVNLVSCFSELILCGKKLAAKNFRV